MGSDPKVSNFASGIKAPRFNFIATITTALVLAAVVAFTPGAAVASTGDPGSSGADTTTQTNTQTHYSNATTDPATSSTGSSASNAARSASSSASAATNADEIEHQKILKKLESANRKATGNSYTVSSPSPSMPAPSSSAATAAPSTSVTVVSNSHSISSASGAAPTTSALAAASFSTSSSASKSSSSAAGSLNRVAATAALTQNAPLTSASAENSDQARECDEGLLLVTGVAPASQTGTATAMLAASDEACTYVCEVPLTSDDAGTTKAPAENTALYVNDGLDVAAILGREDDEAILPSTLSEDEFLLSSGGSYQQATGGQFEAEDSDEGEEPADGEDPAEPAEPKDPADGEGNIDDNADEQPGHNAGSEGSEDTGDTEGADNSGENSGDDSGNNNSDNEGDNSGDETGENGSDPDDPTDPKDPADGEDPAGDDGKDPASNEGEDPAADDASDDPAPAPAAEEVLYLCTSGGTVSRASEPLNDLQGATAKADRGYCFKAWMASTLHGATPVLLTTDKTLTAESVRDFALSLGEDATDIVFTAIFKPNSYTIKYDLQGAQSSDEASIAPTSATFGEDTTPASSCSLKKDGYTFLCWNTDPDGLGVAVRDDESISDNKLHTMLLIDALDDTSDASTTLYARWVPDGATTSATITPSDEPDVTVPTDPVMAAVQAFRDKSYEQMKDPAIAALFANAASAPSASSSASSSTTVAASATVPRPAAAVAAFSPLAALPLVAATEEATESVEVPTDWIATVANLFALPALPPVLDVLPATAEGLTTISENAAVGLGEVDVTPAQAAEAVGITMAAVAGVAAVAGAAGAAATAMANAKTGNGFSRKRRWKFPTR